MNKIAHILVTGLLVSFSTAAISEPALELSGNYVHNSADEKIVLSFPEKGVVLLRRYKLEKSSEGTEYKSIPSESIWAPYIANNNQEARALICENGNPFGHCEATHFKVSENAVLWSGKAFSKSEKTYSKSKFDFGPYTFEKLSEIYKFKFSKIAPQKT